jgi:hypothetical protein
MIVKQTITLIFQYPQDWLQEQEWLKNKDDEWVHKGTDTLCSVYESETSYSIEKTENYPMFGGSKYYFTGRSE